MQLTKQIRQSDVTPHMRALRSWLRGNIIGMYVGTKMKNGKDTGQTAIVMHVEQKKSADRLALDGEPEIPPYFEFPITQKDGSIVMMQVPTDVQAPEPRAAISPGAAPMDSWDRERPCPGGYQIQSMGFNAAGTLGVNYTINGQYRALSCNHVMSMNNMFNQVYQPDTTAPQNFLANVSGFEYLYLYPTSNQFNPIYNQVDLAWCNVDNTICSPVIQDIGTPAGFGTPAANMPCRFFGAMANQVCNVTIRTMDYSCVLRVRLNANTTYYAWFENVMLLSPNPDFALPGDSGAILVNGQMQMVGMLIGSTSMGDIASLLQPQLIH